VPIGSPTVVPTKAPLARTLLGFCLVLCCGFFVVEIVAHALLGNPGEGGEGVRLASRLLEDRYRILSLGRQNLFVYAAAGLLLHAGVAALMSAALQHTWLRNRRLAVSIVLLIFLAFQGAVVALAVGGS
jgi:hypothetical protein